MPIILIILFAFIFYKVSAQKLEKVDENFVFDKAEYHMESVFEAGLNKEQAYVHNGLFFAWIIDNEFYSSSFKEESNKEIEQFKKPEISPAQIFKNWDGVLIGEMLNKKGYNFAKKYFDYETGSYLDDYEKILCPNDPDLFRVEDTWENYDKLKSVIDKAYKKWK